MHVCMYVCVCMYKTHHCKGFQLSSFRRSEKVITTPPLVLSELGTQPIDDKIDKL